MTPEEFARESWQSGHTASALPSLEELRARSDAFRRRILRRNLIEYGAGAFVLVAFGALTLFGPLLAMRIGAALVFGGTCVVLWQMHRRASPLSPMEQGGQLSVLDFQRRELARQRDAIDSVFGWYLAPLIPGMAVIMAIPYLSTPPSAWQLPPLGVVVRLVGVVAVFGGIYALNKAGARGLQRKIDEIDSLRGI